MLDTAGVLAMLAMFALIARQVTRCAGSVAHSAGVTMIPKLPMAPVWCATAACFRTSVPAQAFAVLAVAAGRPVPKEG